MDRTKSADSEDPRPELGLQFNPASPNVAGQTNEAVTDPIGDSQEQEIVVGTAGKAILLGEEIDLESDNGDDHQQLLITQSSKSGRCPIWLNGASPFTKGVLGFFAIVLLAFVGMLIAGVVQLSSPPSGNDGGGASSIQADENAATDPTKPLLPVDVPAAISTPSPTPKPIPSLATASSSPTPAIVIIPISESKVNVALPSYLEMKVPNFADGLNTEEVDNWNLIEDAIETAIFSSLTEEFPTEYKLEAIQVDKFDGFSTSSLRKRTRGRNMMREGLRNQNQLDESDETIHTVVYSTSVTVNCLEVSDCTEVPDTIDSATSYLSEVEYNIQVSVETPAPVAPLPPITDKPSPSPIVVTPVPTTPAPTISRSPTAGPTKAPTKAPVTAAPTVPVALPSRQDECTVYAPCEQCLGGCNVDDDCEPGLLCFLRRGYQPVPGCDGPGLSNLNYCYNPFSNGLTEEVLLPFEEESCDKKDTCAKCKGDCDEDEDCEKGLFCYRRNAFETVPGCAGQGSSGTDYCFDPADLDSSNQDY